MRRIPSGLAVLLALAVPLVAHAATVDVPRARALVSEARARFASGSLEQRHTALERYQEAALLAPDDIGVQDSLGVAWLDARFTHLARTAFEHVLKLRSDDEAAMCGLGEVWRRQWLETAARADLQMAIGYLGAAAQAHPARVDAWTKLAALRVESGDVPGARAAADGALAAAPADANALLAAGDLAFRSGEVERADSLFRAAFARLDRTQRAHYEDVRPLVGGTDAERLEYLLPPERAEYARRFWSASDPDPTTPQNEAEIEYWSRLAHAQVLLGDPWGPRWEGRTELYARYGSHVQIDEDLQPVHYEMPRVAWGEGPVKPTPEALAHLHQVELADGQSVFAPLPPGRRVLPLAVRVARFEDAHGARLLVHVSTAGTPGSALAGDCVVVDSTEHEVARLAQPLSASACDAAGTRAGEFAFTLPPGRYRIAVAVHDGRDGRGVARTTRAVAAPGRGLAMSDLVPVCGPVDVAATGGSVRLNPNPLARVGPGEPLLAYFEITRLRTASGGASHFEYEYHVRALAAAGAPWFRRLLGGDPAAKLAFRTTQEGVGPLRRQFIRVPVNALPAGRYRVELTVRDLEANRSVHEQLDFTKDATAPNTNP